MRAEFVNKIEIIDDNHQTFLSFDANYNGILKLIANYSVILLAYEKNPTATNYRKIIYTVEMLNDAFEKYGIYLTVKDINDENKIKNFFDYIKQNSENFNKKAFNYETNIEKFISKCLITLSNFRTTSDYELSFTSKPEDMDYKILNMSIDVEPDLPTIVDETDEDDELDEEMLDYELFDGGMDPNEIIDDLIEEKNNGAFMETLYSFPLHIDFINDLKSVIKSKIDTEDLVILILYSKVYIDYLKKEKLNEEQLSSLNNLNQLVLSKEDILRKVKPNYESLATYYAESCEFNVHVNHSIYTDFEILIPTIFDHFLSKSDIYFFMDLNDQIKSYDLDNLNDCRYLVKDLSDMLDKYKLNKYLECLKHISTEDNIKNIALAISDQFEITTNSDRFVQIFGKSFGDEGENHGRK